MRVLGIVGSPRKNGNTDILLDNVLESISDYGIEFEKIYLSDYEFTGCTGCEGCHETHRCVLQDGMQEIYKKLEKADGVVLGSPTYFYNVTGITKTFLDRLYMYDIFDDIDRSVWLCKNEIFGIKYAVTVAVCEQNNQEDMGYTSLLMNKSLQAVGYRVVESVKALYLFEKGVAGQKPEIQQTAKEAGEKLAKTLLLAEKVKRTV